MKIANCNIAFFYIDSVSFFYKANIILIDLRFCFSFRRKNDVISYLRSTDLSKLNFPKSDLYKCCFYFIYFQWRTCKTFDQINAVISFADFFELYKIHKDLSQDDFCKLVENRFKK